MQEQQKDMSLYLILSVTDARGEKTLCSLLDQANIPLRFQFRGQGTANSELLRMCGLGESDRIITVWFIPKLAVPILFSKMGAALQLKKRGTGIAVGIPLTAAQMNLARFIHGQETYQIEKDGGDMEKMVEKSNYSMVVVALNQGFSDEVIDTARQFGAKGGTIIKARRRGLDEAMHFWGISLQEEQEILFIIVPREHKKAVMTAISKEYGLHSPAHSIVLALPVEETLGLES